MLHDFFDDYVDDSVVKSKEASQQINDLRKSSLDVDRTTKDESLEMYF